MSANGHPCRKKILTLRKARLSDVPSLLDLINTYAAQKIMLPRTASDLCERIWSFTVAEQGGKLAGCGSLQFYNQDVAEIRSLGVLPGTQAQGVGRQLTEHLIGEARRYGLKTVFVLTVALGFFKKMGFAEIERDTLPMKVWRDCVHCEKYFQCDEKAMVFSLAAEKGIPLEPQTVEVSRP